eukprot:TRINITY_DN4585_c0_g1_i2.p1 TRINITY_DN4585_c0_g1~~TRINITY_DN4585_c0_g1_i2.p1  ORF type:complete len:488 (-),score=69.55 TRINITY_DN4585_c0_g1_i2:78-1541(-)
MAVPPRSPMAPLREDSMAQVDSDPDARDDVMLLLEDPQQPRRVKPLAIAAVALAGLFGTLVWVGRGGSDLAPLRGAPLETLAKYDIDVECLEMGEYYFSDDIPNVLRTVQASPANCLDHCRQTAGCAYFSFWPDGGCILQGDKATQHNASSSNSNVISGHIGCASPGSHAASAWGVEASGEPGTVYAIYTYGAYGSSTPPLPDLSSPTQDFRGLRTYTETRTDVDTTSTDVGAMFNGLAHPRVPTLALYWKGLSDYWPGAGKPELPMHMDDLNRVIDFGMHDMKNYFDRFGTLQVANIPHASQDPIFKEAYDTAWLAWGAYEKQKLWVSNKYITTEEIIDRHLPGKRLVAQTQEKTLDAVDNMFLVQDEKTLDCVFVFEGTHTINEFFGSIGISMAKPHYCGFEGAHKGYGGKLSWLMKYGMPKLRPSLAKCRRVTCTGHALGGALCDIFAACANSGRTDNDQYKDQMWTKGTPELMPKMKQLRISS